MKNLVPMVTSLALCGAAIAALQAGTADADTPRRPTMVAMAAPRLLPSRAVTATPLAEGGSQQAPRPPNTAEMAARHKQMCQDAYAHQVGELAYLEVRLSLTSTQQPLFERWKSAKLDIAKRGEAACSTRELPARGARALPTPLDGMAREQDMLKRRLADLDAEQPPLNTLYNSLTADQKDLLAYPGDHQMADGPMARHGFVELNSRTGRMRQDGPGPSGPGPRPPAPPPH